MASVTVLTTPIYALLIPDAASVVAGSSQTVHKLDNTGLTVHSSSQCILAVGLAA